MNKVIEFFINPLSEHYEVEPKDGPRDTIIEDLDAYTPDELMSAAEWIKRNKQSVTSFPSPKECNAAVGQVTASRSVREAVSGGRITAENFGDLAKAHCDATRKDPLVIKKGEPGWDEWITYYRAIGMTYISGLMENRDEWTVVTRYPSDFDPSFKFHAKAA